MKKLCTRHILVGKAFYKTRYEINRPTLALLIAWA